MVDPPPWRSHPIARVVHGAGMPEAVAPDAAGPAIDPLHAAAERGYLVSGGQPLRGEITVAGAKNAAPKLIIAALLAPSRACWRTCRVSARCS